MSAQDRPGERSFLEQELRALAELEHALAPAQGIDPARFDADFALFASLAAPAGSNPPAGAASLLQLEEAMRAAGLAIDSLSGGGEEGEDVEGAAMSGSQPPGNADSGRDVQEELREIRQLADDLARRSRALLAQSGDATSPMSAPEDTSASTNGPAHDPPGASDSSPKTGGGTGASTATTSPGVAPADASGAPGTGGVGLPPPVASRPVELLITRAPGVMVAVNALPPLSQAAQLLQTEQFGKFIASDTFTPAGFDDLQQPPPSIVVPVKPEAVEQFTANLLQEMDNTVRIEENQPLNLFAAAASAAPPEAIWGPILTPLASGQFTVNLVVCGDTPERPRIAGAMVYLMGNLLPVQGVTDSNGAVTLTLFGETRDSIRSLYVKPRDGYWTLYIERPLLNEAPQQSLVLVHPLSAQRLLAGFPQQQAFGWGEQAMRLGSLRDRYKGNGVRVAIIDSGLDVTHPDLHLPHVDGVDYVDGLPGSWKNDTVGHGTHVAGIIAGTAGDGKGIRGFAPEAEILVLRVFPGGKIDSLLKALDECARRQVDVVNLSLGMPNTSEALREKIAEVRQQGVACIVAAGNSGNDVQFPARFTEVLSVAAIGQVDTYPADSYQAQQIGEGRSTDGQYFRARFTCFGNRIDLCAPGVAIVSSIPGNGYAAWDGTSMACPHVTGLAALLIEANRVAWGPNRDSARVDKLFKALREAAVSLGIDPTIQGSGLPDAVKALPESASPTTPNGSPTTAGDGWDKLLGMLQPLVDFVEQQARM